MKKVDFKKELKDLYRPSARRVSVVDVPEMNFLMADGEGDPNTSSDFQEAVEALYGLAYTLKFMCKEDEEMPDFVVPPLEGLWQIEDMETKEAWQWTLMIMMPDWITDEMFREARQDLARKKDPPGLPRVRFARFHEGTSAQIMHIGPYAEEVPTIEKLHQFIGENRYRPRGRHHEIYLSDPNRTAPENLRTVIRQPIELT